MPPSNTFFQGVTPLLLGSVEANPNLYINYTYLEIELYRVCRRCNGFERSLRADYV